MRRKRKADDDDVFWSDPDEFRVESVGCIQQLTDEPISLTALPEREFPPGFEIPQPKKETASAPDSAAVSRPGARRVRRKKPAT